MRKRDIDFESEPDGRRRAPGGNGGPFRPRHRFVLRRRRVDGGQQAPGGKGTAGEKERAFGLMEKALSNRA